MCSEGSVQDLIAKPENAYGFPESEFFILFSDLSKQYFLSSIFYFLN